jgi:hypothetical protein
MHVSESLMWKRVNLPCCVDYVAKLAIRILRVSQDGEDLGVGRTQGGSLL